MIIRAVHNPNSGIRLVPGRVMQRADDTVHGSPWLILHTPVEGGQIVKHPGGGILSMKETKNTYRRKRKKYIQKLLLYLYCLILTLRRPWCILWPISSMR